MLPKTSHRHERTLARLKERTRPAGRTPLHPRDKEAAFESRQVKLAYAQEMSQAHDTLARREAEMARWLSSVAAEKKRLYGWNTDETIDRSPIDRATWYRWKKISKPGNMPRPAKLDEFCSSLGLDPEVPYQILGWGRPSAKPAELPEPEPIPADSLDRRIRLIEARLDQDPPAEERRRLETLLVRSRRARDLEIERLDEALEEFGIG